MMDPLPQTGHWRNIGPPSVSAQSSSRLHCAGESEIKSIVIAGGSAPLQPATIKSWRRGLLTSRIKSRLEKEYRFSTSTVSPDGGSHWPVNHRKLTFELAFRREARRSSTPNV